MISTIYKAMISAAALCLMLAFVAFVQAQTPPTRDEKLAAAQKVFAEGIALVREGTAESYRSSLEKFQTATRLFREIGEKSGEGSTLNNLGNVYYRSAQYEKARDYYEQSLVIRREIKDRSGEASTLNDLGTVYFYLAQREKAKDHYEQSLDIRREIKDRLGEAETLKNLGSVYLVFGQFEKAKDHYEQSLVISREIKDLRGEGSVSWGLMIMSHVSSNPKLAILYGKQAVNIFQKIRGNIKMLDPESQKNFLANYPFIYRFLSDILIAEGRLPEAQAVLDLLKDEEYEQLARSGETSDTVPYSKAEADVIAKIENLVALERERTELQKLLNTKGELSAEQNKQLEKLNLDIAAANKAFDTALDALGKAEVSAATRVDEIKGGQEIQSALQSLGKETKSGVVALYTVIGTEETERQHPAGSTSRQDAGVPLKSKFGWVIMVTEKGYKAYPIDVTKLEETVFQFRTALSSPTYNPQPLAEKIYKAIFRQTSAIQKRTLEADLRDYLKSHKDKTLMWSLDGVLRYIPMAALHDGKQYLVENYRNVVFTKQSFLWLTKENQTDWRALGLGVSEQREPFPALPGVKTELETIVREPNSKTGILNGSIKLNDNFKKQMFFNTVGNGSFPVVHIASHYSFNPTQQDASFLLVGDGRLTFSELKENKNLFGTLDLLTLSACDTGLSGNGKEAEGFAYLAQSLGAKSVIASLWKVSDAGTPELMIRFYRLRAENPQMSKGEAFRQAQLSLLGIGDQLRTNAEPENPASKVDPPRTDKFIEPGNDLKLPLFVKDPARPFAHPHYWSSFVLIGNWR